MNRSALLNHFNVEMDFKIPLNVAEVLLAICVQDITLQRSLAIVRQVQSPAMKLAIDQIVQGNAESTARLLISVTELTGIAPAIMQAGFKVMYEKAEASADSTMAEVRKLLEQLHVQQP